MPLPIGSVQADTSPPEAAGGHMTEPADPIARRALTLASPSPEPTDLPNSDLTTLAVRALHRNGHLNYCTRLLLMLFCMVAATLALVYVYQRGDTMVEVLQRPRAADEAISEQLLALSAPVLLFGIFAGLAAAAVAVVHSRGMDETFRTLDTISRLRREGEVAVSARGLIFAFEEKLTNARRAFTLLLWFGRTLFIVCLGMFVVALLNSILSGVDLLTVVLGSASVVGALLGVTLSVPRTIAHQLANVIQVQSIVTGCDRQISLLESDALSALNDNGVDAAETHRIVTSVQERMQTVVSRAVAEIPRYPDHPGRAGSE